MLMSFPEAVPPF